MNSKKYVKSEADKWFQNEFLKWAYSIFNRVETEKQEEEDSLEKLHRFIDYEMNRSSDLHSFLCLTCCAFDISLIFHMPVPARTLFQNQQMVL